MKLKDEKKWNSYVSKNTDPYGGCCVMVAKKVMEYLDNDPTPLKKGYYPDPNTAHALICKADNETEAGGITGFMASAVAAMIYQCHERGEEFRKSLENETE
jgi:hypothetical protein